MPPTYTGTTPKTNITISNLHLKPTIPWYAKKQKSSQFTIPMIANHKRIDYSSCEPWLRYSFFIWSPRTHISEAWTNMKSRNTREEQVSRNGWTGSSDWIGDPPTIVTVPEHRSKNLFTECVSDESRSSSAPRDP